MSNKQVSQLTKDLMGAKALLQDKDNWCQGALNEHRWTGETVAVLHCAFGAVYQVVGRDEIMRYRAGCYALNMAALELFPIPPDLSTTPKTYLSGPTKPATYVNDILGFEAVHEMFDRAITNSLVKETAECQ